MPDSISQPSKPVRKSRRVDPDISCLKGCRNALNKSTDRKMLEANLRFLWDFYLVHPSKELPDHLRP